MGGRWLMGRVLCLCVLMTRGLHDAIGLNLDNSREPTDEYDGNDKKDNEWIKGFGSDLEDEDDPFSLRKIRPGEVGSGDKAYVELAQGKYILLYIPGLLHCDYARYQIQNNDPGHTWREMACSEAGKPGWTWASPCDPERWNTLRVFDKLSNDPIIYDKVYALPEKPPRPQVVQTINGPGWVYLFLMFPEERGRNLLGVRLHYKDRGYTKYSTQVLDFDRVKYFGKRALPWPVHQCPQWPKSKLFCMLVTDSVVYERIKFNGSCFPLPLTTGGLDFNIRLFRIPYQEYERKYSDPYLIKELTKNKCNVYEDCPPFDGVFPMIGDKPAGLLFGDDGDGGDGGDDGENGATDFKECPDIEDLWIILLCLCLFVGLVIVPIFFLLAQRRGRQKAYEQWAVWAEAPGNVGVGLGYTAILWKGKRPPWKYDHPPSKPENQPGYMEGRK